KRAGFPHSEIRGSKGARPSPRLFAACHVLHRLSVPRHPPNALKRLIRSPSIAHRDQSRHPRPQKPPLNTQHFILVLPAWPMTIRLLVQRPISRSSAQHKPTAANGQSHSYPQCKTTEVTNRKTKLRSRPRPIPVLFPRKRRSRLLLVEPPSRRSLVGSGGADRDRTGDLLLAKQALSQLSYGPGIRRQQTDDTGRNSLPLPRVFA